MLRILLAIFLLIPMPVLAEDVPYEVTVNEAFDDSTYEEGLTISGGSSDAYIYCSEQGHYNTTGCSLAITSGTYVFEFSEARFVITATLPCLEASSAKLSPETPVPTTT